jgi:hypothetical protein
MLLTIISTILGILSSSIPSIMAYFTKVENDRHELVMGQLKLEAAKQGYQIAIDVAGTQADVSDITSARDADTAPGASQWVENTRALVRPLITYAFFLIFVAVKFLAVAVLVKQNGVSAANLKEITGAILDDPYMAVFSVICGYYFGSRAMEKFIPPVPPTPPPTPPPKHK